MERDPEGFCLTGDEAREEKENRFVLLGRADGVVKVAGKRVDLLDVQNKIKTCPRSATLLFWRCPRIREGKALLRQLLPAI